jgi:hypothetical protein
LKPEEYNPKAREAFGKSLIDIGVSIFKGIMLLFTIVPLTFMLKVAVDGSSKSISFIDLFSFMSTSTYLIFLAVLFCAFFLGYYFRKEGLRHIHEIENPLSCSPNKAESR